MSKETKYTWLAIAAWFSLILGVLIVYLVIQSSHPATTANERMYKACVAGASYEDAVKCKVVKP